MKNNDIYITKLGGNYSLRVYVFFTNFTAILKIATKSAIFVYKTRYIILSNPKLIWIYFIL